MKVSQYLFERISQLGVNHIFGVPGDFNITMLDYIVDHPKLNWIGCCNELNAAYACDGYGKISGLPGVLITTLGVGELSALNGINGANAESVPLIHIVGTTGRPAQSAGINVHHVIPGRNGKPANHSLYVEIASHVACAVADLTSAENAPQEIDRVISTVVRESLPGYIFIPLDVVDLQVDEALISQPLVDLEPRSADPASELAAAEAIVTEIIKSTKPIVLTDILAQRYVSQSYDQTVRELVKLLDCPVTAINTGRGVIDETYAKFLGVYGGAYSHAGLHDFVKTRDLVIHVGAIIADTTSGGYTLAEPKERTVLLFNDSTSVCGQSFPNVHYVPVLKKVVALLAERGGPKPTSTETEGTLPAVIRNSHKSKSKYSITCEVLADGISNFLEENDTVLVDTTQFQSAATDIKLPKGAKLFSQYFYSCIGYGLPATVGFHFGALDKKVPGRLVVVHGEGGAEMSVQELATMARHNVNVVFILINNSGYSIERVIWGEKQVYNDVATYDWKKVLEGFTRDTAIYEHADTAEKLETVLKSKPYSSPDSLGVKFLEVITDPTDYPWRLSDAVRDKDAGNLAAFTAFANKKGEVLEPHPKP